MSGFHNFTDLIAYCKNNPDFFSQKDASGEYVLGIVRGHGKIVQNEYYWKAENVEILATLEPYNKSFDKHKASKPDFASETKDLFKGIVAKNKRMSSLISIETKHTFNTSNGKLLDLESLPHDKKYPEAVSTIGKFANISKTYNSKTILLGDRGLQKIEARLRKRNRKTVHKDLGNCLKDYFDYPETVKMLPKNYFAGRSRLIHSIISGDHEISSKFASKEFRSELFLETTEKNSLNYSQGQAILGFRCWNQIHSCYFSYTDGSILNYPCLQDWYSRDWSTSVCRRGAHAAPEPNGDCHCGFNAFGNFKESFKSTYNQGSQNSIMVAVAGAGNIALHKAGWRAEHARPIAILLAPDGYSKLNERKRKTARYYRVPVFEDQELFEAYSKTQAATVVRKPKKTTVNNIDDKEEKKGFFKGILEALG